MTKKIHPWGNGFDFVMNSPVPARRFRDWYDTKSHFAPRRHELAEVFSEPEMSRAA